MTATAQPQSAASAPAPKTGTDDLRVVRYLLAEHFIGKGLALQVYDPDVHLSRLLGANRRFIEQQVPSHWFSMRSEIEAVIAESDLIVVGLGDTALFAKLQEHVREDQLVLDLVRISRSHNLRGEVMGLCG